MAATTLVTCTRFILRLPNKQDLNVVFPTTSITNICCELPKVPYLRHKLGSGAV